MMFDFLRKTRTDIVEEQKPTQVLLLEDFTKALDRKIEEVMPHHDQWVNKKTGQRMSSLYDISKALRIKYTSAKWKQWSEAIKTQMVDRNDMTVRYDLVNGSSHGTPCIDLSSFEAFLYEQNPLVARNAFLKFKQEQGLL